MRRSTIYSALVLACMAAPPTLAQVDDQNPASSAASDANRGASYEVRDDNENWGWLGLLGLAGLLGLKRREPTQSREHMRSRSPGQPNPY